MAPIRLYNFRLRKEELLAMMPPNDDEALWYLPQMRTARDMYLRLRNHMPIREAMGSVLKQYADWAREGREVPDE